MDWKKLANQAKSVINKRGGPESVKEDAEELREVVEGKGTTSEKFKAAAAAIKEPGAHHEQPAPPPSSGPPPTQPPPGGAEGS